MPKQPNYVYKPRLCIHGNNEITCPACIADEQERQEWLAYCEQMSAEAENRPEPHPHTCRCMSCSGVEYEIYPYPEEN